jgi:DNA invertase Pin-like site-specific DNA recombinase
MVKIPMSLAQTIKAKDRNEMANVGYARVSTSGQKLDVQLEKLGSYGCDKIFSDKKTGTTDQRNGLQEALDYLREGDALIICKLDRLARSTLHLTQIVDRLDRAKIDLVVIDQSIDTSTPTGKLLFNVLAAIGEFETEIRKERQIEGIAKAKANGVRFGRRPKVTPELEQRLKTLRQDGLPIADLCSLTGLSRSSVYRALG